MAEINFLYQQIKEEIGKKALAKIEIPLSISQNLNPKLAIREYQKEAFQYFLAYMEGDHELRKFPAHVLFQMATGSGKTLMMAGLVLYLYEKGYRNFLFFVNSTNILEKTKDNFLNPASSKYLFAPQIQIGNKLVEIVCADSFKEDSDDICIVFNTIQGLYSQVVNSQENALSEQDFENKKIVMIADEAHHLSADTKKNSKQLAIGKKDAFSAWEGGSWEGVVKSIFNSDPENLLLDFTATADLKNAMIANKYKDKLLFDYPLKAFRKDLYSKEVEIFKSDSEQMERALQAVLLSHYRKKLFAEMGFDIKPVILFKSKNIGPSKVFMSDFIEKTTQLHTSDLEQIQKANRTGILGKAFAYFEQKNLDLQDLIEEIKIDFGTERCLSANEEKETEKLQIKLNTLESADNHIRAIFAVDKLNEGWDVLNLFDIVRLYETRDSGKKIGKSTAAEAQLIGRGARYCPFVYQDFAKDKRKFDHDHENKYRICETMLYHSNNDSRYISEITQALLQTGIIEEKIEVRLKLKSSFKNSKTYKEGTIFLNKREKKVNLFTLELGGLINKHIREINLLSGNTITSKVFGEDGEIVENTPEIKKNSITTTAKELNLGKNVLRKAIHRTAGLEFNELALLFKNFKSYDDFISELSEITIHLTGSENQLANLTQDEKLKIAETLLKNCINKNKAEDQYQGSKKFEPSKLKTVITDKTIYFSSENKESNLSENINFESYAFDKFCGTSEEKALIKFMEAKCAELKKTYQECYLIRNERHFHIFDFEQGRRFEPDFVLFLKKQSDKKVKHYQIFIEPKAEYLMKEDKWKETFLESLNKESSLEYVNIEGKEFSIWGLPFFNNKEQIKHRFNESLKTILE
ncbi:MAG: hypothetical protein EAZ97_01875 [Bacteroidetes bacterium]|nr:MAG: hypothetical protein EAZ97_01875 [Bacteroidota bacterium]